MVDNVLVYSKAITAIVAPVVTALLFRVFAFLGIEITADIQNAVILLLTGFFVYLIPNRKAK
jgi:hypothetical protein